MTCREVIEFLNDYVDGELMPPVRERFDEHLSRCGECMQYLRGYRATIEAVKQAECAGEVEIPDALVQAILAAREGRGRTASGSA